jgi:hypothetical protein
MTVLNILAPDHGLRILHKQLVTRNAQQILPYVDHMYESDCCSNTGIVGSNSTRGMDVCVHLFCVCVVLCVGSSLGLMPRSRLSTDCV